MAVARVVQRDRDVTRIPWAVAQRIGWSEQRDCRHAERGCNVQSDRFAGHDQASRAGRARSDPAVRSAAPDAPHPPTLTTASAAPRSPGPTTRLTEGCGGREDVPRHCAKPIGRPSLVRPGRSWIDQRERSRVREPQTPSTERELDSPIGNSSASAGAPSMAAASRQVLPNDMRAFADVTCSV